MFGILVKVAAGAPDNLLERIAATARESRIGVHQLVWSQPGAGHETRVMLELRLPAADSGQQLVEALCALPGVDEVTNLDALIPARRG